MLTKVILISYKSCNFVKKINLNMMKKLTLALCMLIGMSLSTTAQISNVDSNRSQLSIDNEYEEGWNQSGNINIGFAQSHLANWAAGGEVNALNINGLISGFKTRKSGRALWENTYYASYGLAYLQSTDFVPQKTDDRLDLASKYGYQMKENSKWYWTGLGRLQTQFSKGFDYASDEWKNKGTDATPISQFFSPAWITLAIGTEYKPNKNFSWFFSPAAARLTFVNSFYTQDSSRFGVEKGETMRFELGAYSSMTWNAKLTTNIDYRTRLDLYMDYLDPNGFGYVDMLWDNVFAMKVNKYIGMTLGATLMYDNDQPAKKVLQDNGIYDYENNWGWVQLKQIFNVGFAYKF